VGQADRQILHEGHVGDRLSATQLHFGWRSSSMQLRVDDRAGDHVVRHLEGLQLGGIFARLASHVVDSLHRQLQQLRQLDATQLDQSFQDIQLHQLLAEICQGEEIEESLAERGFGCDGVHSEESHHDQVHHGAILDEALDDRLVEMSGEDVADRQSTVVLDSISFLSPSAHDARETGDQFLLLGEDGTGARVGAHVGDGSGHPQHTNRFAVSREADQRWEDPSSQQGSLEGEVVEDGGDDVLALIGGRGDH
jgi:hypothetical protein